MLHIFANSGVVAYGVKNYIIDTEAEVANLPTDCEPTSQAFVIATSNYYMLDSEHKWVKIYPFTGEGDVPEYDEVIYDGGGVVPGLE